MSSAIECKNCTTSRTINYPNPSLINHPQQLTNPLINPRIISLVAIDNEPRIEGSNLFQLNIVVHILLVLNLENYLSVCNVCVFIL